MAPCTSYLTDVVQVAAGHVATPGTGPLTTQDRSLVNLAELVGRFWARVGQFVVARYWTVSITCIALLIFSAWGVGGFVFPRISQMIMAQTGSPEAAYIMCAILLMASSLMALMTNAPESIPTEGSLLGKIRAKLELPRKQPVDVYVGTRYK